MTQMDSAQVLIEQLELAPHPEGGWFRETWRADPDAYGRAKGTAILFLLKAEESSHWHRVDADEMWIWQGGDPLDLGISETEDGPLRWMTLGAAITRGQQLQGLVPKGAWQAARPSGGEAEYSLVSCIVVPGFDFAGFELAAPGWTPGTEARA